MGRQVLNWNLQERRKRGRPKRTRRRTVEEEFGKERKTREKKLEPWPKTGSPGDDTWNPYAPEGVVGNKSSQSDYLVGHPLS
jgi:hypothetical protein